MWWILFVLFGVISVFLSVTLYYALRRINQYENFILDFQKLISISSEKLKTLDEKGSFEADDEVGFFFSEIKSLQLMLDDLFVDNEDVEPGEKKDEA